jgi:hypothetical protein
MDEGHRGRRHASERHCPDASRAAGGLEKRRFRAPAPNSKG